MFEKLRKPNKARRKGRLKSIFSYVIFGIICLVFVFLSPMSSQFFGEGVVAYVGSKPIRSREFRLIEENLRFQYQQQLNKAGTDEFQNLQNQIRENVIQQLINMYFVSQAAEESGFMVSDKELQDEIKSFSFLQRNGRFIYSQYLSFLKSKRLSPVRFEDHIRRFKTTQNWRDIFVKSISSNVLERNKNHERNLYKVKLRFAEIPLSETKVERLETLVLERNLNEVNNFLRKNKISWEVSKEVSPINSFALPILRDRNIMKSIIDHLPSRGLIPKLMMKENKIYLVEILSFKKIPLNKYNKGFAVSPLLDYEKSDRLFKNWMTTQEKEFPIKRSKTFEKSVSF